MRVAVIGHVEWCEFVRVERVPLAGEIVEGSPRARGAGRRRRRGGRPDGSARGSAATSSPRSATTPLARRAIDRLSALGRDGPRREAGRGRRGAAWVYADSQGERTITVIGEKLVPALDDPLSWDVLDAADAVFFVAGADGRARACARGAPPGRHHPLAAARAGRRARRGDRVEQRRLGGVRAGRPAARPPPLSVWTNGARGRALAGGGRPRGDLRGRAAARAASPTPTARATRSPRARRSRLAAATRSRTRSRSARSAAREALTQHRAVRT